jgi:hypothetical protein
MKEMLCSESFERSDYFSNLMRIIVMTACEKDTSLDKVPVMSGSMKRLLKLFVER